MTRDGYFVEGLKIFISTFCVCAYGLQGLTNAFDYQIPVPYTIINFLFASVRHVTWNDEDYLRKIPRVVVQKSALL